MILGNKSLTRKMKTIEPLDKQIKLFAFLCLYMALVRLLLLFGLPP